MKHLFAQVMENACLQTIAVVVMDTLDKNVKLQDLASPLNSTRPTFVTRMEYVWKPTYVLATWIMSELIAVSPFVMV